MELCKYFICIVRILLHCEFFLFLLSYICHSVVESTELVVGVLTPPPSLCSVVYTALWNQNSELLAIMLICFQVLVRC